jgi:hypothetical protein
MAIAIKSIPVLKDSQARVFNSRANDNFKRKRGTVNFSKQVKSANKILSKAAL